LKEQLQATNDAHKLEMEKQQAEAEIWQSKYEKLKGVMRGAMEETE
jgi:hypothetical protein